jgi:hypothetical protein
LMVWWEASLDEVSALFAVSGVLLNPTGRCAACFDIIDYRLQHNGLPA